MAEVLSKSSCFSSPICHNNHHSHSKNRTFPIRCSGPIKNRVKFADSSSLRSDFGGLKLVVDRNGGFWSPRKRNPTSIDAKMGLSIGKAQKWWEKGLQPNMKEITSAQDLVDSLKNAGDKLVVLDFFSPGCGGCKALHPKICQLAEMNPDVQFLQVNYEEHKSMCYSLNVHVLPFFRFYRGAEGRVCSFSCTNATIKKFKDALAKYSPARCTFGPAKGLEEKELLALAANKDLNFTYTPKPVEPEPEPKSEPVPMYEAGVEEATVVSSSSNAELPYPPAPLRTPELREEKTLVSAGRRF